MSKSLTPLALTLALAFGAAAHADVTKLTGDVYQEAIWDIHADAQEYDGKAGASAAADVYQEAIWDIHAGLGAQQFTGRLAEAQSASRGIADAHPASKEPLDVNAHRAENVE